MHLAWKGEKKKVKNMCISIEEKNASWSCHKKSLLFGLSLFFFCVPTFLNTVSNKINFGIQISFFENTSHDEMDSEEQHIYI